ncbi:MAG: hypothetical protein JWR84_3230 [Caulobacter sp.]|nr:hypothetical protein [Caulobacter sp.]
MAGTPTAGDDNIVGTAGKDTIDALGGNDTIDGLGGNDILKGSAGDDIITGGLGNDTLYGLAGNDTAIYNNTVVQAASAGPAVMGSWVGALLHMTTGGLDGTDVLNAFEKLIINGVTFDVNVAAHNVVARLGADVGNGVEDSGPVTGNVLANDYDVDSQLTVTGVSFGASVGTVGAGLAGAHGTLTLNGNGTYNYSPGANQNGTDVFTYQVMDGGVAKNVTLTINVSAVNDAPVANDSAHTVDEDTVINSSVTATDPDSVPTYTVGTGPSHGALTLNPDGSYQYTPNANYHGTDSFTFVASDGQYQDSGQVDITLNSVPGDVLVVGAGGYASIQAAIDAAEAGDTIQITAGTYHENVLVNKSGITLVGVGEVNLTGTFKTDNGISGDVNTWLETAPGYSPASGAALTVSANNVSISNINIDSYYTGVETSGDLTGLSLTNVDVSNGIFGLHKELDNGSLDGVTVTGGSFSKMHIGIDFEKNPGITGNDVVNFTLDGTSFSDITAKGFYAETLTNGHLTDFTMTHVGYFGGTPSFGGFAGSGIELNLKKGAYSGIEIDHFTMTNVGQSTRFGAPHDNAAAISIKPRDDSGSYTPVSITDVIKIHDGTIDGTSTGIRNGETGKNHVTGTMEIENVVITNGVHNAQNGDIESRTQANTHIIGSDGADNWVVNPQSIGTISFDLGDGNDTVSGGTSTSVLTINGGDGADSLTGGAGADNITGGAGGDIIVGGGGLDTAHYGVELSASDFDGAGGTFTVDAGAEGIDALGVEKVVDASGDVFWLVSAGGSIQAAVNAAADGDTILIAAGNYREQVIIDNRDLSIVASDGAVLESPDHAAITSAGAYSVLAIINGSNVTVDGLTIDGRHQGGTTGNLFATQQFGGVAFLDSDGAFRDGAISGMTNAVLGPYQYGYGVIARSTGAEHHVEISDTEISDYQKNGIDARGAGLVVDIYDNTVTGQGATSTIGQNGVVLVGGVEGVIDDNTISSIGFIPGFNTAVGILVFGNGAASLDITNNAITMADTGSDTGINLVSSEGAVITGNIITDANIGISQNSDLNTPLDGPSLDNNTFVNVDIRFEFDSDDDSASDYTVTGTAGDDYLDGSASGDLLDGADGNDELAGMDGDDALVGGAGNDLIDGGDGSDTASYDVELSGADFGFASGAFTLNAGAEGSDTLSGVEKVVDASGDVFWLVSAGSSIQAAVNAAADGDIIVIGEGVYREQVVIDNRDLAIVAVGDAVLESPDHASVTSAGLYSVLAIINGSNVSVDGLTIDGRHQGTGFGNQQFAGVAFIDSDGAFRGGEIIGMTDTTIAGGGQHGFGVLARSSGAEHHVEISGTDINDFQKNAIDARGAGLVIDLHGNAIAGAGSTSDIAQNGIVLLGGVEGSIDGNTITDIGYIGPFTAVGVLLHTNGSAPVTVTNNVITMADTGSDTAISLVNTEAQTVTGNTITDSNSGVAQSGEFANVLSTVESNTFVNVAYQLDFFPDDTLPDAFDVTGTTGSDYIGGADGDDTLNGGTGNDEIDGFGGTDTVILAALSTGSSAVQAGATLTVTSADGTDTLDNVEAVQFTDRTVTVHNGNAVLIDANDTADVNENASVGGNVLSNVYDLDNDTLTVIALLDTHGAPVTPSSGVYTVAGAYGTLTLNANGGFSYNATSDAPNGGQILTETFTYTASDGGDTTVHTLVVSVHGAWEVINGTNAANTLQGSSQGDQINGLDGIDKLFGNGGDDQLNGGEGNDQLNGGAGADDMHGNNGNDSYTVDNAGDTVVEAAGEGTDSVSSSVTFVLGDNVESLTLTGSANLGGTGNAGANTLNGNTGNNYLNGLGGNDILRGGDGADVMYGGTGNDQLYGQGGADHFIFENGSILLSGTRESDIVRDFNVAEGDRIDLSAIDANSILAGDQAFTIVSSFSGVAGQALVQFTGGSTLMRLDVNGDGQEDMRISIIGNHVGTTVLTGGEPDSQGGWIL